MENKEEIPGEISKAIFLEFSKKKTEISEGFF